MSAAASSLHAGATAKHAPVLLHEVMAALGLRDGGLYVDGTFGAGGYTRAMLDGATTRVIGIDRDPAAVATGRAFEAEASDRFRMVEGCFGDMGELVPPVLAGWGRDDVDGVALDLGVSSMQLDEAARGFSFRFDGPLDMRMDAGTSGSPSAAAVVNSYAEDDLARLFRLLGEERHAGRVARAIVWRRADEPFTRTADLADVVARAVGGKPQRIHPATRVFQALRIHVNDELGELACGLAAAETLLSEGGRLAVVSFHSLEDRIVKRFFAGRTGAGPRPSRHLPDMKAGPEPTFRLVGRKPIDPQEGETDANPRARSARLRAAERTAAPARPLDFSALGVPSVAGGGSR